MYVDGKVIYIINLKNKSKTIISTDSKREVIKTTSVHERKTNSSRSSSDFYSQGIEKNFVKIRQHDSDVSPRPRRPYPNDSSSHLYYNYKSSDVSGQGRIIGEPNQRSVTSGVEAVAGRRHQYQQQSYKNYNHSSLDYNNHSQQQSYNYNSSQLPPDPIKGGGTNNSYRNKEYHQGSGNVRSISPYQQQQQQQGVNSYNRNNYSKNSGNNNYFTSQKYDNRNRASENNSSSSSSSPNFNSRSGRENHFSDESSNGQSRRNYKNNSLDNKNKVNGGGPVSKPYIIRPESSSSENVQQKNGSGSVERWIPPSLRPQHGLTQKEKNDATFRKVRGILNKLTPEKFQELSDELLKIDLNSPVVLNGIIILIFEKALDEPKYSSMYAQLCKRLSKEAPNFDDPPVSTTCTFLRLLLNVCRDKFLSRSTNIIFSPLSTPTIIKKESPQKNLNSDDDIDSDEEERRHIAKQRMLGNVKFIGELSKLQMLSANILHKCIQQLLDKNARPVTNGQDMCEDVECLCQLIKTCGKNLDTEQGKKLMDQYFEKMDRRSKSNKYPPRIRFMLRDVIELRENSWVPRKVTATEGPVPIRQIRTDDDEDSLIRPQYINQRNRDLRNNDRDNDNWMNRFPLNLQSGYTDMFSSLSVTGSPTPILSPGFNNNNNRIHNQRNNNQNSYGNNYQSRYSKHQNNNQQQSNNNSNTMVVLNNKDLAPRFKRTLIQTAQESVENLQMRPAANSLLFKANMNIKKPPLLPISTPLTSTTNERNSSPNRHTGGGIIIAIQQPKQPENKLVDEIIQTNIRKEIPVIYEIKSTGNIADVHKVISNSSSQIDDIPLITKQGSSEKSSNKSGKKEKGLSKDEVLKKVSIFVTENFINLTDDDLSDFDSNKITDIVKTFMNLKIPDKYMKEGCYIVLNELIDKTEKQQELCIEFLQLLTKNSKAQANAVVDALKQLVKSMNEKEATIPRITTLVASLLSRAVTVNICKLSDIASYTEGGQHYPLILLVLQQLHKTMGRDELENLFTSSKVNLISCLPESDRNKDRLSDILEDRNLTFLYPLLKVQSEMLKQIQTEQNPANFYKWIKSKVDAKYFKDSGFISSLMTVILKHITQETTLSDGIDTKKYPDKLVVDKEVQLLRKYCHILENFLTGSVDLQLIAVYALQVYCNNVDFPKGMLCRWFKNLYEANVIEEDVFFRWKEEITDEYPGKGTALFQVNQWLTWLEQAESEDEED